MKKIIIISFSVTLALFLVNSCKKGNIYGDKSTLVLGSYITLDSVINENLDFSNPSATVSIKIGSKGDPVASVNIYAATGSNSLDPSGWVLIKNVPYSDGVVLSVSTAELSTALAQKGLTIQPGNQYPLYNEVVTSDGRKFSVSNTPSTYNSFPAYHMALAWQATAVCAFDQASSLGLYKVTYDGDWVDYATGDTINVFAGPDPNSVSFYAYPGAQDGGVDRQPWVVEVDPASGAATVADQYVGMYGSTIARVSATGFVFSCTGVISLVVTVNYGGAPYANLHFSLQKQ
jgi:hypothetical protein